ncbi:hypothetical protein Cob_v001886 [Colletotrichum orbiculare MAFF 240422]|uniref:Gag1-like clamp domain-containing protein n=1 Tax=Colletotrichum orbiculare (strain 104-T / ATCC 96160 / CBS 514.97 / LARS 414 / MAFF 240422) TaxID=1213857 RepID=N4V964_COLOR|nr:hypothetical protein Cob_v001886 [Colletotrichum orbiculare MAFF 240422]
MASSSPTEASATSTPRQATATRVEAPTVDASVVGSTPRPESGQDRGMGNDYAHLAAQPAPLEAEAKATIRPPAAIPAPGTGALHHPHHQPTPHATVTATTTTTATATPIATPAVAEPASESTSTTPASATPAATTLADTTTTATLPLASSAHTNIINKPSVSLDPSSPLMPPPSLSSAVAPTPTPAPTSSTSASASANPQPKTHPSASTSPSTSKMLFSDIYKSPRSPLAKFRHTMSQQPLALDLPDYDPDLLSKDKLKQKEAVKKYLASKIRNDWEFVWPPVVVPSAVPKDADAASRLALADTQDSAPAQEITAQDQESIDANSETEATTLKEDAAVETLQSADEEVEEEEDEDSSDSDAESVYSTVSEDATRFKPRLEWVSDLSDEEPTLSLSPFRFDSPDAIGAAVKASVAEKRTLRRRALREEMEWNEGLACFEARRNAWTGARTVRLRSKPISPAQTFSPLSPRRLFFRSSMILPPPAASASHSSPPHSLQQRPSNEASAIVSDGSELTKDPSKELSTQKSKDSAKSTALPASLTYPVETIIPVPPPLLPPANPMRASITPSVYMSLYEKVILHALTPSCPVNLGDMIRACVVGWKRDGEWPPKPSAVDPGVVAVRRRKKPQPETSHTTSRRLSFGFLGRGEKTEGQDDGGSKGIRKSLQRVLGLGHHHPPSNANGNANNMAANTKESTAA